MPATEQVETLKSKHADLEQLINDEEHRPLPDQALISELKRQKLRIKDQIASIHHTRKEELPFWQSNSLEELADRQGVEPVAELDQLTASWPADKAFDDALGELLRDRVARRQALKTG